LGGNIRALRRCTSLPIAGGFGISDGRQARRAAEAADGVVVGSALVRAARQGKLRPLVRELRVALD
jgi:tryptophan synthase alpha chain